MHPRSSVCLLKFVSFVFFLNVWIGNKFSTSQFFFFFFKKSLAIIRKCFAAKIYARLSFITADSSLNPSGHTILLILKIDWKFYVPPCRWQRPPLPFGRVFSWIFCSTSPAPLFINIFSIRFWNFSFASQFKKLQTLPNSVFWIFSYKNFFLFKFSAP